MATSADPAAKCYLGVECAHSGGHLAGLALTGRGNLRRDAFTTRTADRSTLPSRTAKCLPNMGPYDNAKAESFMRTLKVEAAYLMCVS
jgi:hypothetical protein